MNILSTLFLVVLSFSTNAQLLTPDEAFNVAMRAEWERTVPGRQGLMRIAEKYTLLGMGFSDLADVLSEQKSEYLLTQLATTPAQVLTKIDETYLDTIDEDSFLLDMTGLTIGCFSNINTGLVHDIDEVFKVIDLAWKRSGYVQGSINFAKGIIPGLADLVKDLLLPTNGAPNLTGGIENRIISQLIFEVALFWNTDLDDFLEQIKKFYPEGTIIDFQNLEGLERISRQGCFATGLFVSRVIQFLLPAKIKFRPSGKTISRKPRLDSDIPSRPKIASVSSDIIEGQLRASYPNLSNRSIQIMMEYSLSSPIELLHWYGKWSFTELRPLLKGKLNLGDRLRYLSYDQNTNTFTISRWGGDLSIPDQAVRWLTQDLEPLGLQNLQVDAFTGGSRSMGSVRTVTATGTVSDNTLQFLFGD